MPDASHWVVRRSCLNCLCVSRHRRAALSCVASSRCASRPSRASIVPSLRSADARALRLPPPGSAPPPPPPPPPFAPPPPPPLFFFGAGAGPAGGRGGKGGGGGGGGRPRPKG